MPEKQVTLPLNKQTPWRSNHWGSMVLMQCSLLPECNEESLLQRQQAAVWENSAQWTSPPSPSSTAEISSMKKRRLFRSAQSRSAFTSSWTAWMRRSHSRGTGSSVTRSVHGSECAGLDGCVCLSGLRWGVQQLSVWRTSWPLGLESTSGTNTKTTETPCWFI